MYDDCVFLGPLLSPGFLAKGLSAHLGPAPFDLGAAWSGVRRGLAAFAGAGGPVRVMRHALIPLCEAAALGAPRPNLPVRTAEGREDGGASARVRVWAVDATLDLDTPSKRGDIARGSPTRRALRVLRACGERIGLVTNGCELRLLLCDPSGPDSQIVVRLSGRGGWAARTDPPESFRLVTGLMAMTAADEMFDAARLHQTAVTRTLRARARAAIEDFIRAIPDRENADPAILWRQTLTLVYRLLFVLKMEGAAEPGQGFSFAASDAWRRGLSPNRALGPLARRHLDHGHDTGRLLEDGLRTLFRVCGEGLVHGSLSIAPLAGGLFDPAATASIDRLAWGERAVALMLDKLLWTEPGPRARERVHYGTLDVEVLGHVYESLLDLIPAIATVPMTRVRRGRVEAVLPADQTTEGEPVPAGCFFTRTGLGRRSGGAYYTPHGFVAHLVRETLTPLVAGRDPAGILRIKVFDPAMGSGHFLVEACRFLGHALYEACLRHDPCDLGEIAPYLPDRACDRSESGPSRTRALGICRRLVATHCLYGADRDALAVELAKLSLWLESFAEGLPLTFLDHRLVSGDSIAGPFFADMARFPVDGGELDPLLAHGVTADLTDRVRRAMIEVRHLEATIGTSVADLMVKHAAKARLDHLMAPLIGLARAWSGAAATRGRGANDAWLGLVRSVVDRNVTVPDRLQTDLLDRGASALALDLVFPEVFRPGEGGGGFDAVLGNPPWDVVHYQTKEYLAAFDPAVMDAPTRRERASIEARLLADPAVRDGFEAYKAEFVERKRLCDRLFPGVAGGGSVDLFQVFAARMLDCVRPGGAIGVVVPSSLHANEGTASSRRRLLDEMTLESCFSFENRRKLFDIHGRQKFALVVARRTGPTESFRCGFYLETAAHLNDPARIMVYDRAFLAATGGGSETFLELSGQADLRVARHMFIGRPSMGRWLGERQIVFGREAHMTDDAHRFVPIGEVSPDAALPLHEGKTFHQFTDRWKAAPRYAIPLIALQDKPTWARAAGHFRLVFREIARSNDERTMIAAIVPPGHVFGHKGTCEKTPWTRSVTDALVLAAIFNAFPFDWCVRRKTAASVSLFMVHGCPAPSLPPDAARFLAHGALRLSCRHAGYRPLWHEVMGTVPFPRAPAGLDLRAAMDAVVAHGYGLAREDYCHILTGFNHAANPGLLDLCLEAFDTLTCDGMDALVRRHQGHPAMARPIASATRIPSMPADMMPPAYPAPSPAG